jgi:hypothetical protein
MADSQAWYAICGRRYNGVFCTTGTGNIFVIALIEKLRIVLPRTEQAGFNFFNWGKLGVAS